MALQPHSQNWTIETLRETIFSNEVVIIVGVAPWKASSMKLLQDIKSLSLEYPVISLVIEDEDEQELALSLEITEIPTVLIYRNKGYILAKLIGDNASISNIQNALSEKPTSSSSKNSCCGPSSSCCAPSSIDLSSGDDVRKMVASQYAATLRGGASCCVSVDSTLNGYTIEDIQTAGVANLGLGCGNPMSVANLQEGECVVDLGSGAGVDCFIAAKSVGSTGQVIGIDMTPDMVYQARQNAKDFGVTNVSFRLGEIEYLPVRDSSVDVVISNCVINLSPDKQQVFHEIFRVLKSNGRVAISDLINRENMILPESLKTAEALAC